MILVSFRLAFELKLIVRQLKWQQTYGRSKVVLAKSLLYWTTRIMKTHVNFFNTIFKPLKKKKEKVFNRLPCNRIMIKWI